MKELLESGVHFGHQTRRWNPKMAKYIFAERNGIYIIDLQKTLRMLETACDYVQEIAAQGGTVLFVGTKRQSQESVIEEATRCEMFYVSHRWLGGMLTNFQTIRRSIQRLEKLEADEASGVFDQLPKKEVIRLAREKTKLTNNLTGIKAMKRSPDAVIITDTRKEHTAILESNKLGIPVIGIVDTNCDPQLIDFPIPGNDDAIRAIRLICSVLATSIIEGRGSASEGADISEAVQSEAVVESDEPEAAGTRDEVEASATDGDGETPTSAVEAETTAKRPQRRKRASTKSKKVGAESEPREAEAAAAQSVTEDSATKAKTEDEVESKPKPARRRRRTSTKTKKADAETGTPEVETAAPESISEDSATRENTEPVEADSSAKPARRRRRTSAKAKKAEAETETAEVEIAATEPISEGSATEEKAESVEADSTAKPARRKRRTSTKTKKADAEPAEATASDTPTPSTTTVADEATEAEA